MEIQIHHTFPSYAMTPNHFESYDRARRELDLVEQIRDQKDPLPPARGRSCEELNECHRKLIDELLPRAQDVFPGMPHKQFERRTALLATMAGELDHDERWLAFSLIVQYDQYVSPLQIREAVLHLGGQADLFIHGWVTGAHQQHTGAQDYLIGLWEYETRMKLTPEGARRVREYLDLPDPRRTGEADGPDRREGRFSR